MQKFKNESNLPMSIAVFLAHDDYPERKEDNVISVTTLLKPVKQIVLGRRLPKGKGASLTDVSTRIASSIGTAIHNGVEHAWCSKKLPETLEALGYPQGLINSLQINPHDDEIDEDRIQVYTEFRTERELEGFIITGEFDFLADGRIRDIKSTGTYTYVHGTMDDKYPLQGSMYRWLNPKKVTDDVMAIDFVFTDWSALAARTTANYPPSRIMEKLYNLLPIPDTERFMRDKITLIKMFDDKDESEIPECTNEELWVEPSTFKYYKSSDAKRATRVYSTRAEAEAHYRRDGSVGMVLEHKGEVKACRYCDAVSICQQAQRYLNSGELKL